MEAAHSEYTMCRGGLPVPSSKQAHRWTHERCVWDYFIRAYRNSGVRALLNEAYHATLTRVVDSALARPHYVSHRIQTQGIIASVMTPQLYLLTISSGKTRGWLFFEVNRSGYSLVSLEFNKGSDGRPILRLTCEAHVRALVWRPKHEQKCDASQGLRKTPQNGPRVDA